MTAATIDTFTGGRFRLGLGVSGPQVSEGWHGVRFAKPLARTREYVDIVRLALAREKVAYDGEHYQLPLPDGAGKALRLTVHPVRDHIPIYLAAVGPKNLELTGEIADGWLAIFFAPEFAEELLAPIAAGRAKSGKTMDGFDVVPTRAARRRRRPRRLRGPGPLLRRALRRRHGQPGAELLQPARHPDGLRRGGDGGAGPLPGANGRRRRPRPYPWSSSTGRACSARSTGSRRGCATTPPPVSPPCQCRCSSPMPRTACARCAPLPQALELSGVGE